MEKIISTINAYFIEMVKDQQSKAELAFRLSMSVEERQGYTLPETKNFTDAFYVSVGCRFQDKPLQTVIISTAFIIVVGLTIANIITKFL